jgi:hypothetical protein
LDHGFRGGDRWVPVVAWTGACGDISGWPGVGCAAAATYYALFAIFAPGLLGFAVFGFVLNDAAIVRSVAVYFATDPAVDGAERAHDLTFGRA